MDELIENSEDYGIYIVDRRAKSVEESVNQLAEQMFSFAQKTRRQRINQRNRTERLSDLLDWRRMGLEYAKARQLALRRAYPSSFEDEFDFDESKVRVPRPLSAPSSPRLRSGMMTPGDIGTLTEEMQSLATSGSFIAFQLRAS
jgi:glycogen(starch) synthase